MLSTQNILPRLPSYFIMSKCKALFISRTFFVTGKAEGNAVLNVGIYVLLAFKKTKSVLESTYTK